MSRKSIGKRLRFQIFDRDMFTCQYCGRTPPDVKLEIDHIIAVSNGGTNEVENLRTSCSACNLGKTNTQLGQVSNEKDSKRRAQEAMEAYDVAKQFIESKKKRDEMRDLVTGFVCDCLAATECKAATVNSLVSAIDSFGGSDVMKWFERAVDVTARYGRTDETNAMKYFHGIVRRVKQQEEDL